jgi:hypothetical protein
MNDGHRHRDRWLINAQMRRKGAGFNVNHHEKLSMRGECG